MTRGLCRRCEARPESCCQVVRRGDPSQQNGNAEFLGFANYYREFIPWHAKLVAPLHAVTGLNVTFTWGPEQQKAFNEMKKALIEATALAQPDSEGEFVLDTDANSVAISGILHQWQGPPGERRLRSIVYGTKKLTTTQAKYGALKSEMFAAYYLSPRTQHRNADGLSKRTNEYRCRKKQLAQQSDAGERWNFLSADEFDNLPLERWSSNSKSPRSTCALAESGAWGS